MNKNVLDKPIAASLIAVLIVYSVVCFSLETLPNLPSAVIDLLRYSELFIVAVFTLEYLYRIYAAEKRLSFVFSFYGLVDLLAILPFYLATAIDLSSLRLVRIFRLLLILKLARYNAAIQRFVKAVYLVKEELVIFVMASLVMLFLAAIGFYHFEHEAQPEVFRTIFDCLWWAVASFTTVGYGDVYPITVGGRLFTFVVLMLGLGLVAVPTGILASALSAIRRKQESDKQLDETQA